MEVKTCSIEDIFDVFSACKGDLPTLLLDVRPHKDFAKSHLLHAFNLRLSANGAVLLDYSKAAYDHQRWVEGCWWDRHCIVYGAPALPKDHPVPAWLSRDGHARSVRIFKDGFEALAAALPFLCTSSVKTHAAKRYPSRLEPYLYLGDWEHAEQRDRLAELGVRSVVTIHNNPERLSLPAGVRHLRIQLADVESEDISPWLQQSHVFIETAREAGHAVLVHCGAGVSRSAALCIAHLMRRRQWSAQQALQEVQARRSIVKPNDGFWHALCSLEGQLGVAARSNPEAFSGVHGMDYVADAAAAPAALRKVEVSFTAAGAEAAPKPVPEQLERSRSRSRSRSRTRKRKHCRSRDRVEPSQPHARTASQLPDDPAAAAPAEVALAQGSEAVVVEVVKGDEAVGRLSVALSLPSQQCIFGRLPSCEVPLEHLSISRHHAKLHTDGAGRFFFTDLGSAHGTNLDGAWLRPHVARQLKEGAVLRFGASTREYKVTHLPGPAT